MGQHGQPMGDDGHAVLNDISVQIGSLIYCIFMHEKACLCIFGCGIKQIACSDQFALQKLGDFMIQKVQCA